MAEVLSVEMGALFQSGHDEAFPVVFRQADMQTVPLPEMADTGTKCWQVPQIDAASRHTPNLIEIPS